MSNFLDMLRPEKELVPYFVIQDWIKKCEDALMPSVERDYARIHEELFRDKKPAAEGERKLYSATAGGPCSKKSTELDFEIASGSDPRYERAVIIDPDRYTMDYMFTYRNLLTAGAKALLGVKEAFVQAYNRARPGSNMISNANLNEAFDGDYHIVHGTTMTAPTVGKTLEALGAEGYERRLMLCYAHDSVRTEAGRKRIGAEAHYQVDVSDFAEKGRMFPQRHDAYFTHGDHLILLWSGELEQRATRAAEYKDGERIILDENAFRAYTRKYEMDRAALAKDGIGIPSFDEIEQLYFARFAKPEAQLGNILEALPEMPQFPTVTASWRISDYRFY